jgi:hypothetical protein
VELEPSLAAAWGVWDMLEQECRCGEGLTFSTGSSISSTLPLISVMRSASPLASTIRPACSMMLEQSTPITSLHVTAGNHHLVKRPYVETRHLLLYLPDATARQGVGPYLAPALAANMDRIAVPHPTSSTTLPANKCLQERSQGHSTGARGVNLLMTVVRGPLNKERSVLTCCA